MRKMCCVTLGWIVLLGAGCSMPVLRQDIPVSTNPMGAQMYVDGQYAGTTPGTVSLERTKDHILTLVKEDYRQEDVVIRRQYQQDRVLMKAVQSGLDSGLFFKDPRMGFQSGFGSVSSQEQTGEAYVLVPSAVKVELLPAGASRDGRAGLAGAVREERLDPAYDASVQSSTGERGAGAAVLIGAGAAGAAAAKPVEKKWETSSSTRTYVKPDGTTVTKSSKSSVGVGVNPAGLVDVVDKLFR